MPSIHRSGERIPGFNGVIRGGTTIVICRLSGIFSRLTGFLSRRYAGAICPQPIDILGKL